MDIDNNCYDAELESDLLDRLRQSNSPLSLSNLCELVGVYDEKELAPIIDKLTQANLIYLVDEAVYGLRGKSYESSSSPMKSNANSQPPQVLHVSAPAANSIRAPPPHILLQQRAVTSPQRPVQCNSNHQNSINNVPPINPVIPSAKPLRGLLKLVHEKRLLQTPDGTISPPALQSSPPIATQPAAPIVPNHDSLSTNFSQTDSPSQTSPNSSDNSSGYKRVRTPAEVLGVPEPIMKDHRAKIMPDLSDYHKKQPDINTTCQVANMNTLNNEFFNTLNKNPVSAIFEFSQMRGLNCSIDVIRTYGPPHRLKMEMAVTIGSRKFPPVTVTNKKDGKREAADAALRVLLSEGVFNKQDLPQTTSVEKLAAQGDQEMTMSHTNSGTTFDRCAALTHSKFAELVGKLSQMVSKYSNSGPLPNLAGRKVLAGIIMRDANRAGWETVISLGTGNRCITGNSISVQGLVVNDSHAEIVARRGLIRFFYKEILKVLIGKQTSEIISFNQDYAAAFKRRMNETTEASKLVTDSLSSEPSENNRRTSLPPMFQLREGLSLHLYISTAPCGDGALFSPRDKTSQSTCSNISDETHSPIFETPVQGLLRTKIEYGEGTIPVEKDAPRQTLDGIMRGDRLKTMSCSDKIMRWNFLGLQGNLLSQFLEPVYLSSITLGYLFDPGHLSRAVCCRLERAVTLEAPRQQLCAANLVTPPPPYRVNHPKLGRVTACEPQRETNKTNELSLNWCLGDDLPEVVDGTTGQCLEKIDGYPKVSRLSKAHLFTLFREVARVSSRSDLLNLETYQQAKNASVNYLIAKRHMLARLKVLKLGKWMSKPAEEDMFYSGK